jgi:hypothetical protein
MRRRSAARVKSFSSAGAANGRKPPTLGFQPARHEVSVDRLRVFIGSFNVDLRSAGLNIDTGINFMSMPIDCLL